MSTNRLAQKILRMHGEMDEGESKARKAFQQHPPTLLIVDDEDEIRDLLTVLLQRLPVQLYLVSSGREALSIFRDKNIDGVLLDCALPGMDGFAIAEKIREMEQSKMRPPVRLGFMTGRSNLVGKTTLLQEVQASLYLRKPEDMTTDACRKIAAWLGVSLESCTG
jgi:CheY-like chemotaxis protein